MGYPQARVMKMNYPGKEKKMGLLRINVEWLVKVYKINETYFCVLILLVQYDFANPELLAHDNSRLKSLWNNIRNYK